MTIWECLDKIEDPREASGKRYELGSILKMMVVSLLAGRKSLGHMVLWGRSLPAKAKEDLGFKRNIPCPATLSNLLRRIDAMKAEEMLGQYTLKGEKLLECGSHIALDGKTLRGSHEEGVPLVHLLSAFLVEVQGVVGQIKMAKGENEITAALRLLEEIPLEGVVVTGDAIFAQKKYVT